MTPDFRVVADTQDITNLLRDRLLLIRTTDKPGLEADECEIHLDDRDGAVAFPKKGATIEVSLGYAGRPLAFVGKYIVDEIEISGPPQSLVIRGKPADVAATLKSQRRHSWEGATLAGIVRDIAHRNQLQPLCRIESAVPRVDQINESDMHFITRLARRHGATAAVKDGKLIVAARGEGKSGAGKPLPPITLHRDDLARYTLAFPDRSLYGAVQANYHDPRSGKLEVVTLPNPAASTGVQAPTHTERHVHPTREAAEVAASSRAAALNRGTMTGQLELTSGRADIGAETSLTLVGIKKEADGAYLVESVEQSFSKSAWLTTLRINAGNSGKGKTGRDKKAAGSLKIISLPGTTG